MERKFNRDKNRNTERKPFRKENRPYATDKRKTVRRFSDDERTEEGRTEDPKRRKIYRTERTENNTERRVIKRRERPAGAGDNRAHAPLRRNRFTSDEAGDRNERRQKHYSNKKVLEHNLKNMTDETELRLNRYISMSGVCSRRDADILIKEGRVKVNGVVVTAVGSKVRKGDNVSVDDVRVIPERKVYLVLNKPKDYVTTLDDPLERKTVMSLVADACKERIFPVGRLDRQTTGVLLFTNDGDLSKKLTHPSYEHKKIYHVFLDKPLLPKDADAIRNGIELEDGTVKADQIEYVSTDQTQVGIEIHSGRNRIVRRIFEFLGYQIVKLDRVYFAGITKKNLARGKWRFLKPEEVRILKIYNSI